MKPQIDGLGRLGGLVAEILVARAFGVKEVLRTHIYLPESASTSPHEIEIRSRTLPRCVGLDRLATKSNRGEIERGIVGGRRLDLTVWERHCLPQLEQMRFRMALVDS